MTAEPYPMRRLAAGCRVVVTGGAGFIGSHLVEELLRRHCRVTVLDDLSTGDLANLEPVRSNEGLRFIEGPVTEEGLVARLAGECDLIVHLAAAVGVELILEDPVHVLEDNILGAHAVLKGASRHGTPVLFASSSEIYGKSERVPFAETDDRILGSTYNSRWSYSTSKAVGEYLALAYHRQNGLPVVIFRLFNTVGPRQTGRYGMVVPRFVRQALRGEPITVYGDGAQSRSFCDVRDAVRAICGLAVCPQAVGEVVNVGSAEEISILELARRVLALVARRSTSATARSDHHGLVCIPYEEAYEPGFEDMRRRVPDLTRHRQLTGWQPRIPLAQTLESIVEYTAAQLAAQRSTEASRGGSD